MGGGAVGAKFDSSHFIFQKKNNLKSNINKKLINLLSNLFKVG